MTGQTLDETKLVLTRVYDAPVERVYRAFTEAADLARWFAPEPGWRPEVREADVRPGGRLVVAFGPPGAEPYVETNEYLEVVAGERLVFRMTISRSDMPVPSRGLVTIEFRADGPRTIVTVTDVGTADDLDSRPGGWSRTLENLKRVLRQQNGRSRYIP